MDMSQSVVFGDQLSVIGCSMRFFVPEIGGPQRLVVLIDL